MIDRILETRIRVEKSEHKTEYFPECSYHTTSWFKIVTEWASHPPYGVSDCWESARFAMKSKGFPRTREYAEKFIDLYYAYRNALEKEQEHNNNKQVIYYKYP